MLNRGLIYSIRDISCAYESQASVHIISHNLFPNAKTITTSSVRKIFSRNKTNILYYLTA